MRAEGDRRWQALSKTIREALIGQDLLGLKGIGRLPHGDKSEGFGVWLREELRHKVLGYNGDWLRPFIKQAVAIAQKHAHQHAPKGRHDPIRAASMETLAISELRGIVEAAQQQIVRAVTHAMMANATPTQTANAASAVIRTMRHRTRAMAEYMVAKTHATTTLSAFRDADVKSVGIIPEKVRKRRTGRIRDAWSPEAREASAEARRRNAKWKRMAYARLARAEAWARAHGGKGHHTNIPAGYGSKAFGSEFEGDAADARRPVAGPGSRSSREETPSPAVIAAIERTQAKLEKQFPGEVEVLTAADDLVCPICEEISGDGPYTLDEAEGLIPAHVFCRCGFVPAEDARFAHDSDRGETEKI
jgi:hypothetical protein